MINSLSKMIDIKNLTVKYRSPSGDIIAIKDINFCMNKGEICAVLGPSGCGKSTLLHVLSGIVNDYSGEVLIDTNPVNPKLQRIGLVPQNYGLLEWNTVFDNSVLGLKLKNGDLNQHQEHIENVLKRLGIDDIRNRFPSQLSGGQRQRVSLARSFIMDPHVLLMDEPFSSLDAITREDTQDLFMEIWKSNRVTTLFVTHSIEEALFVGQKILIFTPSPGRISRIIDNPVFGVEGLRFKRAFYDLAVDIRRIVKEDWQNDG